MPPVTRLMRNALCRTSCRDKQSAETGEKQSPKAPVAARTATGRLYSVVGSKPGMALQARPKQAQPWRSPSTRRTPPRPKREV